VILAAVGINSAGVLSAFCGWTHFAVLSFVVAVVVASAALSLFAGTERPAKLKGVHSSFPVFIRLSYLWALVAALLGTWAASTRDAHGIWGASRHALTVGFLATMVFAIGQRVLPAFAGMKLLFSTKLMFVSLVLLTIGCALRVSSEVLAYQDFLPFAWSWLPVSAIIEMAAVTVFAVNLFATFTSTPPSSNV
jgi:uncharacterized protein involved in response to NO